VSKFLLFILVATLNACGADAPESNTDIFCNKGVVYRNKTYTPLYLKDEKTGIYKTQTCEE